jgi:hypothetical protein
MDRELDALLDDMLLESDARFEQRYQATKHEVRAWIDRTGPVPRSWR